MVLKRMLTIRIASETAIPKNIANIEDHVKELHTFAYVLGSAIESSFPAYFMQ